MNYGKEVKKAKVKRSDHRKAKLPIVASRRPDRDPADFITVEREHDQLGRFGASLGTVYFDSDGDGKKDTYGKNRRTGSVGGLLEIPTFGPIEPPISGPSGLTAVRLADPISAPTSGPSNLTATTDIPLAVPAEGPSGLTATPEAPAEGPSSLSATINPPAEGPSSLVAGFAAPSEGPSGLGASINAPVAGPSGLSAELATLNIEIVSDQSFADSAGSIDGEIKYSSDVGYLFIYDSSEGVWHRTNGGNS